MVPTDEPTNGASLEPGKPPLTTCTLCRAAIKKSINMWHIKHHYFTSHPRLNYFAIVPVGPGPWYDAPSDRAEKFAQK